MQYVIQEFWYMPPWGTCYHNPKNIVQGDSVARGPKLLSIKNYVIEIMT